MDQALEQVGAPYLRRAERIAFDMMVKYRLWGFRGQTILKDMTPFGARIEGLNDLRLGDGITLLLPGLQPKEATVVWSEGSATGVEFDHPLHGEVFKTLVRDYARSRPTFEMVAAEAMPPLTQVNIAA